MSLFPPECVVGIFRGFSQGGMEFQADLVLPYRPTFQSTPMHGQFVLVQLASEDEAVLGRITSIASHGRLASGPGEDYSLRAVRDNRPIPEDLREDYLKYEVHIRVLGVLRVTDGRVVFAASHRRLPHVGATVAFLSDDLLREVAGHHGSGAQLGFLAFGEFVYGRGDPRLRVEPWMLASDPLVVPRFDAGSLVARRSFVFARAGFGKSNLVKLLFSDLYSGRPTITKRGGREVPVGTVLFDPDGEYFWPDDKDRPGLCDVEALEDQLVVFTNRDGPSAYYRSFVAAGIKLDIRRLRPGDVLAIALPPERQDQQNVLKMKGMNDGDWSRLVDAVDRDGNGTDLTLVAELLRLDPGKQDAEAVAARSNLTRVVRMLHDRSSQMLDMLLASLRAGKLCVVDVSQLRGAPALALSGIILQRIFDYNQEQFTEREPRAIPTIAVVEEAQSVLGASGAQGDGPYVTWVKEGRKYDLGAVLITQQPGSIGHEILSQGDNWFVFHLLSSGDLVAVKRANAHYSDDLLSSLLNEPIPGHCVFWSSAAGKPYPVPMRIMSFEDTHQRADPDYGRAPVATYARSLRKRFQERLDEAVPAPAPTAEEAHEDELPPPEPGTSDEPVDALNAYLSRAVRAVAGDDRVRWRLTNKGIPWRGLVVELEKHLPDELDRRNELAYRNVESMLNAMFGPGGWTTDRRPKAGTPGGTTLWVIAAPRDPEGHEG